MKIKVKLYGTLSSHIPDYEHSQGINVEILDGATVDDLLVHLAISETSAPVVIVEGRVLKASDNIQDGLPVDIFQRIEGG